MHLMTTDSNISGVSNAVMHYALPMKHYEVCLDTLLKENIQKLQQMI